MVHWKAVAPKSNTNPI